MGTVEGVVRDADARLASTAQPKKHIGRNVRVRVAPTDPAPAAVKILVAHQGCDAVSQAFIETRLQGWVVRAGGLQGAIGFQIGQEVGQDRLIVAGTRRRGQRFQTVEQGGG